MTGAGYAYHDLEPPTDTFAVDVLRGLAQPVRAIPPKYFYDAAGSALFEQICALPEYYPTRTELAIMRGHVATMAAELGPDCALIEFGSGSGIKTRVLLEALRPLAYLPIDISAAPLREAAARCAAEFPDLSVTAVHADYSQALDLTPLLPAAARRRVVYFSGSTIGNFTPAEAQAFLCRVHALVGRGGALLIGVDLQKDVRVLNAAYNDAAGVTAAFNLNLLARMNRELGADFDLAAWSHRAFYDAGRERIEMHLASAAGQRVCVAGRAFEFAAGETIHTEISCKYTIDGFQALAARAGFTANGCWMDDDRYFSVHALVAR